MHAAEPCARGARTLAARSAKIARNAWGVQGGEAPRLLAAQRRFFRILVMDRKFPYTCVFPRVILKVWVPDLDQICGIEIRIRDVDSQALAASWRKCRWRQLHVVGGGAREGAGLAAPRMPLELPGAVAGGASLTWWEGEREGVGLAPPRQAGGAMATIPEKLNTELSPRRSDGHDLREMALGMAFEAARWPRSSRNCTQNGLRGSAMSTIFG